MEARAEASQEKKNAQMEARAEACQDKADAKIEARLDQFNEEIKTRQEKADAEAKARHERFLAILDRWKSYGKGMTTCQTETTSCPEEMKDAIEMEINPGGTQATVECQELQMEEADVDAVG
jgi:hypothetical protein